MDHFLLQKIILFLINTIGIWFMLWVYLADPKAKINRSFSVMTLLSLIWIDFSYLANTTTDIQQSLLWTRLAEASILLFAIALYFFSIYFPAESKRTIVSKNLLSILIIIFVPLVLFTDLITKEMIEIEGWGFSPTPGRLWYLFHGAVFFTIVFVLYHLFKKYKTISDAEKLKVQYCWVGMLIFLLINIIFNIALPLYYKDYRFIQIGTSSSIFFLGFTAYAVAKRQLFGIKVVLTQLLVGFIAILLLVNFFGSESAFEYVWKGGLFVVFLLFGWLLVRSVMREIKQRERLDKLATELASANVKLEGAYKKLQKLDKAKSEFISIASHQLRAPLTAIKGYVSMLLEGDYGKLDKEKVHPLENVYASNTRLLNLVNSLLDLSRLEAGKIQFDKTAFSIVALVKDLAQEYEKMAEEKGLYLKLEKIEKDVPNITADQQKIRQVLGNLIDNAIKYTEKGGIKIALTLQGKKVKVAVSDTGAGLTQDDISGLFQTFSRVGAGKRLWVEGSGLGLHVARKFIDMHKGRIWAESKGRGKGSTFYVELPVS